MVFGQSDVLVHVERDDVLEADLALFHEGDEVFVGWDWARACRQPEHKLVLRRGIEIANAKQQRQRQ